MPSGALKQPLNRSFTNRMLWGVWNNFMGNAAQWYKMTIIAFLFINPVLLQVAGPFITGWVLVAEFIFTLAMALKCYPLQPGGLIALQSVFLGMTTTNQVYLEAHHNFEVILLLMFMVAGIYFMKDLLLFCFSKILLNIRSKILLSFIFCVTSAVLSAFLDALTVIAVIIAVAVGFYAVFHKVSSGKGFHHEHDHGDDGSVHDHHREDLEQFRAFLRSLLMHAAIGTALGGASTMVGEPQNLLIATTMGWDFITFAQKMAPVTFPVFLGGILTCMMLERFKVLGYGTELPESTRKILQEFEAHESEKRNDKDKAKLLVQALGALFLVVGLALHLAAVGLIGLAVIVLLTTFTGITEEHQIGKAFEEALPFTALLVVFFTIVAVIHTQHLFQPIIEGVLALPPEKQTPMFFIANGVLSVISDNVFVATVYITEVKAAFQNGLISAEQFDKLAIAINAGTNLPSVGTPNGQAAFLFLLTSAVANLVRLSYVRMVIMALPYTIVLSILGYLAILVI